MAKQGWPAEGQEEGVEIMEPKRDRDFLVVKFCVIQKLLPGHQGPKHLELRGRLPLGDVLCGEGFYEFEEVPAPENQPMDPNFYPLHTLKQVRDYGDDDELESDDPGPAPDSQKTLWVEFVFSKARPYRLGQWERFQGVE